MKTTKTTDWLNVIATEMRIQPEKVPAGWLTLDDIKAQLQLTYNKARYFIDTAIECGKVEKREFVIVKHNKVQKIWHYKKKKKK
jgi:hypothetical protein